MHEQYRQEVRPAAALSLASVHDGWIEPMSSQSATPSMQMEMSTALSERYIILITSVLAPASTLVPEAKVIEPMLPAFWLRGTVLPLSATRAAAAERIAHSTEQARAAVLLTARTGAIALAPPAFGRAVRDGVWALSRAGAAGWSSREHARHLTTIRRVHVVKRSLRRLPWSVRIPRPVLWHNALPALRTCVVLGQPRFHTLAVEPVGAR